ncbi:hypothetical protein [Dyadobacter sp. MSC1_007]|jgi:transcriptional regulator with XRE-family HTH domain|uniref:hypothetical protein n=1 Tax=Dyadobacter sp. MSC1_007 TaxID=2909264 RepID=UPI00202FBEE9|nr:hypothetical protein [Dyadobacter sp. MSC1_007]
MAENIGQIIKRVAEGKGISQKGLGEKINRTKQGIASIYRRATIDTDLLKDISIALDYDFFAHFYDDPSLTKFREQQFLNLKGQIEPLIEKLEQANKLISSQQETLAVQRKLIAKLEESVDRQKER